MPRIITSTRRRMQRVGFLKHVAAFASPQRPSAATSIGRALLGAVSHKCAIAVNPEMEEYCNRVFSEQHYRALRSQVQEAAQRRPPGQVRLELQDIYLSQDVLPSKRGRILSEREKDIHLFPTLAVSLGFLTPEPHVLTSRGRLFLSTVLPEEMDAFNRPSNTNPLRVSSSQAMVLLFSFVETDGDLGSMLYPAIAKKDAPFADHEVGDTIGELLSSYVLEAEKSAGGMRDRTEISRLKRVAGGIKEWKNKEYSGKGVRDEWATLRLEPFVDMGVLTKPDKFGYKYAFTDGGRGFASRLETMENLESFLRDEYVGASAQLVGLQGSAADDPAEVLDSLKESNRVLSNNIGYSDVTDTALMSAVHMLHQRNKVLEIGEAIRIMKDAQRRAPREMHFNIDRWGNLKFINFRRL